MRQVVLANHNLHVNAKCIRRAKHLNNAPARGAAGSREVGNLHIHRKPFQRSVAWPILRRAPPALLRLRLFAEYAVRRFNGGCRNLRALGNQDRAAALRARHPLIQRRNVAAVQQRRIVPRAPAAPRPRVMKDADHGRIAPRQHARNAAGATPIASRRGLIHQHLIALHCAVQLVRRNKQIVVAIRAAIGTHEAVAIAMQVEPACHQPVARRPSTTLGAPFTRSIYRA